MGLCIRVYTWRLRKSTSVYMAEKQQLPSDQPKRPRNAVATREAILQSALVAFSRHGYGIGVREIAQTAGLTADVMTKSEKDAEPINPFFLLLRSAPNPRAAEILRDSIARHFERPLKALLRGPRAGERAAVILAVVTGLSLFRRVLGNRALADANAASLSGDLKTMFQRLIDGAVRRESRV